MARSRRRALGAWPIYSFYFYINRCKTLVLIKQEQTNCSASFREPGVSQNPSRPCLLPHARPQRPRAVEHVSSFDLLPLTPTAYDHDSVRIQSLSIWYQGPLTRTEWCCSMVRCLRSQEFSKSKSNLTAYNSTLQITDYLVSSYSTDPKKHRLPKESCLQSII